MKNLQVKFLLGAMLLGSSVASVNLMAASAALSEITPGSACRAYNPNENSNLQTHFGNIINNLNPSAGSTSIQCDLKDLTGDVTLGAATTSVTMKLDHGTAFAAYNCYISRENPSTGAQELITATSNTLVNGRQSVPLLAAAGSPTPAKAWNLAAFTVVNNHYVAGCFLPRSHSVEAIQVINGPSTL